MVDVTIMFMLEEILWLWQKVKKDTPIHHIHLFLYSDVEDLALEAV